jgi:hypothetical protein
LSYASYLPLGLLDDLSPYIFRDDLRVVWVVHAVADGSQRNARANGRSRRSFSLSTANRNHACRLTHYGVAGLPMIGSTPRAIRQLLTMHYRFPQNEYVSEVGNGIIDLNHHRTF